MVSHEMTRYKPCRSTDFAFGVEDHGKLDLGLVWPGTDHQGEDPALVLLVDGRRVQEGIEPFQSANLPQKATTASNPSAGAIGSGWRPLPSGTWVMNPASTVARSA